MKLKLQHVKVSVAHSLLVQKIGAHVIIDEARTPFDPINEIVRLSDSVERT